MDAITLSMIATLNMIAIDHRCPPMPYDMSTGECVEAPAPFDHWWPDTICEASIGAVVVEGCAVPITVEMSEQQILEFHFEIFFEQHDR